MSRPAARMLDETLHWGGRIITGYPTVLIGGMPAARLLVDFHVCLMHGGGPIMGPGSPTVLIGGLPAAAMGDAAACIGPPDLIIKGCETVLLGGPALPSWLSDLIKGLGPPDLLYTIIGSVFPLAPLIIELAKGKSLSDLTWSISVLVLNTNIVGYMTVAAAGVAAAAAVAVAVAAVVWVAVVKVQPAEVRAGAPQRYELGTSILETVMRSDMVQDMEGGGYYAPMYFL